MSESSTVLLRRDARGVATVSIDNPRKLNSLSMATMGEFIDIVSGLAADPTLRVLVITGKAIAPSWGAPTSSNWAS